MVFTFKLVRTDDETGVSGTGHVADGAIFPDGTTVLVWRTETSSVGIYKSIYQCQKIHGHDGKTVIVPTYNGEDSNNMEDLNNFSDVLYRAREEMRESYVSMRLGRLLIGDQLTIDGKLVKVEQALTRTITEEDPDIYLEYLRDHIGELGTVIAYTIQGDEK